MGKKYQYFSNHSSRESFDPVKFLKIQKCNTLEASQKDFEEFLDSIISSTRTDAKHLKVKEFALEIQSSYDIMKSPKVNNYWRKIMRKSTRSNMATAAAKQAHNISKEALLASKSTDEECTDDEECTSQLEDETDERKYTDNNEINEVESVKPTNNEIDQDAKHDNSDTEYDNRTNTTGTNTKEIPKYYYLTTNGHDYNFTLDRKSLSWILPSGENVLNHFINSRNQVISKAEDLEILDTSEQLILNGILVINHETEKYGAVPITVLKELQDEVMKEEVMNIDKLEKFELDAVREFTTSMSYIVYKKSIVEDKIDEWTEKEGVKPTKSTGAILNSLLSTYSANYNSTTVNEATLVRDCVDPFLKSSFQNTLYTKCVGADTEIKSSSMRFTNIDPSLTNHGKRADFSVVTNDADEHLLFTTEAKSHKTRGNYELLKLGREMKDSLDAINKDIHYDVGVVGLLATGLSCELYYMDHKYDGMYRMIMISKFYIPRDRFDMFVLPNVVAVFKKLKTMIETTAVALFDEPTTTTRAPRPIPAFHSPMAIHRTKRLNLNKNSPEVRSARRKLFH